MASIRQLPSGKYNVQIRSTKSTPKSKTFLTLKEAERWAADYENKIGTVSFEKKNTAEIDFLDLALRYCRVVLTNPNTRHITEGRVRRISARLPYDVSEITKFHVNEYRLKRLELVSPATVREELQTIHRVYRWAHRELILDKKEWPSPVSEVAMPPASKPRSRIIQRQELELLLSALSPVMKSIVELAYETAMRRGEIVKLTPNNIDLDSRILSVIEGKTGDRSVPLTRRAVAILRSAVEQCRTPTTQLFPVTPHAVSTALRRARKQVGLDDDVRLHQLRHTRITEVAKKGFNQAQIMMVSGHRDVRSVQRYTHLNVRDVIDLLD